MEYKSFEHLAVHSQIVTRRWLYLALAITVLYWMVHLFTSYAAIPQKPLQESGNVTTRLNWGDGDKP